ncbi:MAG: hypothetical protein E3J35_07215 [Methanomassiliicoccales archaeon]|nr:MAG: hypothetical protein E3J35_07215 [Methanomassiliicoccales archaeon]
MRREGAISVVALILIGGFLGLLITESANVRGTDVSGIIYDGSGGPWTLAGSPYIVVDDVTVPVGENLTIEPGVQAKIDYYVSIYVDGSLVAVGTEMNKIIMTSNSPTPEDYEWYGVVVSSSGYVDVEYCEMSFAFNAIYIDSSDGNKIINNYLTKNRDGIELQWSNNNQIIDNNISDEGGGIYLYHSDYNVITNNSFYSNKGSTILFEYSDYNTFTNNIMAHDLAGIHFTWSDHNNVSDNTFINSGIYLSMGQLTDYTTHTIQNNTVNGKPLRYFTDCAGITVDGESVGQVIFANCDNIMVNNLRIGNTYGAVQLIYTSNSRVTNNSLWNVSSGVYLKNSDWNRISNNNVSLAGRAIRILSSDHNTIENNGIESNMYGVYFGWSRMNTLANNTISYNDERGVDIYQGCEDNIVRNNTITNNERGIYLASRSKGSRVEGNTISNNEETGIEIYMSTNNYIMGNSLLNDGVFIWGNQLSHYNTHIIPDNNVVNGRPLYYHKNCSGIDIDGMPIGQLILANCTNVDVRHLKASNAFVGIEIAFSTGVVLTSNNLTNNSRGIYLDNALRSEITSNNISGNGKGVHLRYSSSNITYNNVSNNGLGISIHHSPYNNITENQVSNNTRGIYVEYSYDNRIFHNSFTDNENRAYDGSNDNFWNDSYPSGGNYWSDYSGVDQNHGPNQDIPGADGIGDSPYKIGLGQDNYPLVSPYGYETIPPIVGITSPTEGEIFDTTPITVAGTASDMGGSGLERVEVHLDGGSWSDAVGTSTWSISQNLNPGTNFIEARAWDNAGNPSAIVSITVEYNPPGNDPPTASFTVTPETGDVNTLFTLDASSSSDMDEPSDALEVRWDWEDDGVWDTDWSKTKTTQHRYENPGIYTIYLEVKDSGGLKDEATKQLRVEYFPTPRITNPAEGETISGEYTITGTTHDPDGKAERVEISIDQGDWVGVDGILSWNHTWETTNVSNGNHTICVRAYDGTNYSVNVSVTVVVDNPPPKDPLDYLFWTTVALIVVVLLIVITFILIKRRKAKSREKV